MDKPFIVVAGATATGKTNAAIELAKSIGGEIISADSMQVYKFMDIGTAKPTADEMQGIPHYMLDEVFPDEEFNIAIFKERADYYAQKIRKKGKYPIIAGGTGFYINALINDTEFGGTTANEEIRAFYARIASEEGAERLHEILRKKDSLSAEKIHPNNIKRVIRALEYFDTCGESIEIHNQNQKTKIQNENIYYYILDMERSILYEKINQRVDRMIEENLVGEVQSLIDKGYNEKLTSMQGIGYKEIIEFLKNDCSYDVAIEKIKKGTRNYAKRQITWFRHQAKGLMVSALEISKESEYFCKIVKRNLLGE